MSVDVAYDGHEGYGKATSHGYNVLALDRRRARISTFPATREGTRRSLSHG